MFMCLVYEPIHNLILIFWKTHPCFVSAMVKKKLYLLWYISSLVQSNPPKGMAE